MLIDLAENRHRGFISLKEISERQGISKKYLEQLITILNRPDILRTNRGKMGGYMLAKDPDHYTIGALLRITEGGLSPVSCLQDEPNRCERSGFCKTLPVWQGLEKIINNYLDGITIQDIIDQSKNDSAGEYHI